MLRVAVRFIMRQGNNDGNGNIGDYDDDVDDEYDDDDDNDDDDNILNDDDQGGEELNGSPAVDPQCFGGRRRHWHLESASLGRLHRSTMSTSPSSLVPFSSSL